MNGSYTRQRGEIGRRGGGGGGSGSMGAVTVRGGERGRARVGQGESQSESRLKWCIRDFSMHYDKFAAKMSIMRCEPTK